MSKILNKWKLQRGVVTLIPKEQGLAKVQPQEMPHRPGANITPVWARVIAHRKEKGYLCLFSGQRKWLPADRVRIL